jgi:hypothetical protein
LIYYARKIGALNGSIVLYLRKIEKREKKILGAI